MVFSQLMCQIYKDYIESIKNPRKKFSKFEKKSLYSHSKTLWQISMSNSSIASSKINLEIEGQLFCKKNQFIQNFSNILF